MTDNLIAEYISESYFGSYLLAIALISLTLFILNQEMINVFIIQPVKFARPAFYMEYIKSAFNTSKFDAVINNHT